MSIFLKTSVEKRRWNPEEGHSFLKANRTDTGLRSRLVLGCPELKVRHIIDECQRYEWASIWRRMHRVPIRIDARLKLRERAAPPRNRFLRMCAIPTIYVAITVSRSEPKKVEKLEKVKISRSLGTFSRSDFSQGRSLQTRDFYFCLKVGKRFCFLKVSPSLKGFFTVKRNWFRVVLPECIQHHSTVYCQQKEQQMMIKKHVWIMKIYKSRYTKK